MSFSCEVNCVYIQLLKAPTETLIRTIDTLTTMDFQITTPDSDQLEELIELRLAAMRPSLEAIGRHDPERSARRFKNSYDRSNTKCILVSGTLAGFYVLGSLDDHLSLDHLYIHPAFQGMGIGSRIIESVKKLSSSTGKPVKLGALRASRSNDFYRSHQFVKTHEEEFDIYYEYSP